MLQQVTCILLYVCFHVLQQNTAQQAHGLPGACCRCCCRQSLPQVAFSAHTRHPNIVQLLDVFADKERRTLVIVVRGIWRYCSALTAQEPSKLHSCVPSSDAGPGEIIGCVQGTWQSIQPAWLLCMCSMRSNHHVALGL